VTKKVRYAKNIVPDIRSSSTSSSLIVQEVLLKVELEPIGASSLLNGRHSHGRMRHW
jgi:hypothetical protein